MEQLYARLFNFANGYLNDQEVSREVLQDVFLQLWDNRNRLAQNTSLKAYLYTLTRNRCIDIIRKERVALQFQKEKREKYLRLTENINALNDPILDNLFACELEKEIENIIDQLPGQCQRIFILSRKEGLKNKEISLALNISEKTVESHISKALRTLRDSLNKKFPGCVNLIFIMSLMNWNSRKNKFSIG